VFPLPDRVLLLLPQPQLSLLLQNTVAAEPGLQVSSFY
jgi:hypothetical protein